LSVLYFIAECRIVSLTSPHMYFSFS